MTQPPIFLSSRRNAVHLHSLLALVALTACGGGSDAPASPPPPVACATNCVSGIAASGKAIASATVTLTDATGATRSATTAADGAYQIDSTGLVAPFLLKVAAASGTTFYSVSADTNAKTTVNLTQLTDLVVRSWYGAQGIDAATAFSAPAANPAPSSAVLSTLSANVQSIVQVWLDKNNVPSGFNLISSPFVANGSGIDAVLDATAVAVASPGAATVTIVGGTLTQSTSLAIAAGSVTATTTTTDSATGTQSSSVTTAVVPVASGASSALEAIKARLAAFASTVNTKGAALAAADLQPHVDPNLLDDGRTAAQFIDGILGDLAGSTIGMEVQSVVTLDLAASHAALKLLLTQSAGGQTGTDSFNLPFRLVNGNWLISGNGQAYGFEAKAEMRTDSGANSGWNRCDGAPSGPGMSINVDVRAPSGQFAGGSISGGGAIWPNIINGTPTACVTSATMSQGATSIENGFSADGFFINTGPIAAASLPAAGTPITASMTLAAGGAAVPVTVNLNAWTSDPVTITAPTNPALSSIVFGAASPVSWTLPTTYAIQSVRLSALTFTGPSNDPATQQCSVEALLARNATSGSVTIPGTCAGLPVLQVNINVGVDGVNGRRSQAIFSMQ